MKTLNENQEAFVKGILSSVNQAIEIQKDLIKAIEIGGSQNQQAAIDHFENLGSFIQSALRMVLLFNMAFSFGTKAIADEVQKDTEN